MMSGTSTYRSSQGRSSHSRPGWGTAIARNRGLDPEGVLVNELQSLEWRIGLLENVAIIRWTKWLGKWVIRLYKKLGHMLLRTPLAGPINRLMGHVGPEEKYRRWLQLHRATDSYLNHAVSAEIANAGGPLITIVTPVYQPSLPWLKKAIDSVRLQSYPRWQLLIVFDGDPGIEVIAYLDECMRGEPRIQSLSGERGGISSTLNLGLHSASGAYTAFLDQDDVLEETALGHVASAILEYHPDILYSDEGYIDENGVAQLPMFKPAWSPALLLSGMYLCHFLVVDTERAKAIGGFRSARDGAQDYDLVLRLTDDGANVVHLPRILYHWRRHANSTALDHRAKPYSHLAGLKALEDAVWRRGLAATVHDGPTPNSYKLSQRFRADVTAAIIVPTRNPKLLARMLTSLAKRHNELPLEIHIILHCQGGEADAEIARIAQRHRARLIEFRGPFSFALMNNIAAAGILSEYLVFMNDDVMVQGDRWLDDLCSGFVRDEVGIVGARLLYPNGTIQHSGIVTGMSDGVGHASRFQFGSPFWPYLAMTRNVSAVTGACLAIRRSLFGQLGGFDLRFHNNYNDVDLCLRAQSAGYEVVLNCESPLCHEEGRTRRAGTDLAERLAIWARWGSVFVEPDYFYSPNLSRRLETIDLADPCSK
jgi:GT2 family glycosyltransferase